MKWTVKVWMTGVAEPMVFYGVDDDTARLFEGLPFTTNPERLRIAFGVHRVTFAPGSVYLTEVLEDREWER